MQGRGRDEGEEEGMGGRDEAKEEGMGEVEMRERKRAEADNRGRRKWKNAEEEIEEWKMYNLVEEECRMK